MQSSGFFVQRSASIGNDTMAALVTALSIIPQSLVFAFLAGVDPSAALLSALFINSSIALINAQPVMISTPVTIFSVVMIRLVGDHGYPYLVALGILSGVLQLLIGYFRLGKYVRMLPRIVVTGFINGMAIVIFLNQLNFLSASFEGEVTWLPTDELIYTLLIAALAWGIIYYFPRVTTKIPSALVALVVVTSVVLVFDIPVYSISDFKAWVDFKNNPSLFPIFEGWIFSKELLDWNVFFSLIPYALLLAIYSTSQSLVTLAVMDDLTDNKSNANREMLAIGTANIVSGLLGGVSGSANIEQSMTNYKSGGRTRLSVILTSVFLGIFLFLIPDLVGKLPVPVFIGLMIGVVGGSFALSSLRVINKFQKSDAIILVSVSIITILFNSALAVLVGVVFSALAFSWESALRIRVRKSIDELGAKQYEIYGPLFFGSSSLFMRKFNPEEDVNEVHFDFLECRIWDHSGIDTVKSLIEKYQESGRVVKIKHLSSDSRLLLRKEGVKDVEFIVDKNDPEYLVVEDMPLKFY